MKKTVTLERVYDATQSELWEMWTTKEGIESWWGPDGFVVFVHEIDLRVGGLLRYQMTAVGAEAIDAMKNAREPLTQELRARYVLIQPERVAAWANIVDFIGGVDPYEAETRIELSDAGEGRTRLQLHVGVMHAERWTNLAVEGWRSELSKLERALKQRGERP
jgi:uncharacterized protein YndB with AHSA1/START domain